MYKHGKNRATLAESTLPYLRDISQSWVRCSYCGRTVVYSQLIKHQRIFHNYGEKGGLIIDF